MAMSPLRKRTRLELQTLASCLSPYRGRLVTATVLLLGGSAAALAIPWLAGRFAGRLLADESGGHELLLWLLGVLTIQAAFSFGSDFLLTRTGEQVMIDLRIRVYDHLQSLPLGYYDRKRQGDVLTLLGRDVAILSAYASNVLARLAPLLLTFAGAAAMMLWMDFQLALLAVALVPVLGLLVKLTSRRLGSLSQELAAEHATAFSIAEENLGMLPAIKAFTREEASSQRFRSQMDRILGLTSKQLALASALAPSVRLLGAGAIVGILWLASSRLAEGSLDSARLVSFLMYGLLLSQPTARLADVYGQTKLARGATERLLDLLDEPPEPLGNLARSLPDVRSSIEFAGVGFSYPGREPTLRHVDLKIQAGEKIALTGPNGAGKSTLAHLLMRFHIPQRGRILIDGVDIATVSLRSLRSLIGLVPQNILLFNGTIAENISYSRLDASLEAIQEAAVGARADQFIAALPDGYQTVVGDRGIRLSGGQKQRVALARALLRKPSILILDEATAMFDPQAEEEFLEIGGALLSGRTVIVITHRPATLRLADRILHVHDGVVEERPRREEPVAIQTG